MQENVAIEKEVCCYHCGEPCLSDHINFDQKDFCCHGCKTVYELFQDTGLQDIYTETNRLKFEDTHRYAFLDNEEIANGLIRFRSDNHMTVQLTLPTIHCSYCVYLLENLSLFDKGILKVSVNFVKQQADIHFNPQLITLKKLATLLHQLGYPPQFSSQTKSQKKSDLPVKIGVAAFCFGNIMLLSFPEYLGFEDSIDQSFQTFFAYLNMVLAVPVLVYSGVDYLTSAYRGLKKRIVNIDVPIALGMITLFMRSAFEVLSQTGSGYFDSLAGLVFFLLVGKWFQSKTYEHLSFERDYKAYFPLAATKYLDGETSIVPINQLQEGDEIVIRNQEIIPADAIVISEGANIDYSFVTGEEQPLGISVGERVYAGGRQVGPGIHVRITQPSAQSYLTSLWNNQAFKEEKSKGTEEITNRISKYFTVIILLIAILTGVYWAWANVSYIWQSVTAVLIVACPCALALSAPFAYGNLLRVLGRNKFYLKNTLSVEKLNKIDTIVFDKTGTLTESSSGEVEFHGKALSQEERNWVGQLVANSMHPLSKKIANYLKKDGECTLAGFVETPGKGLSAVVDGQQLKIGSAEFVGSRETESSRVYLSINQTIWGYFDLNSHYRSGLKALINQLRSYNLVVLSGDSDREKSVLSKLFPESAEMHFRQQPQDKLNFIKSLQDGGQRVMMLGDGLNDAGALKQSDMGIAITEDVSTFSPACDAILEGRELKKLAKFLKLASVGQGIVIASFVISFLYNIVGLSFAVSGMLTPIFAAILMPLSSISVVAFTTLTGNYFARKKHLL